MARVVAPTVHLVYTANSVRSWMDPAAIKDVLLRALGESFQASSVYVVLPAAARIIEEEFRPSNCFGRRPGFMTCLASELFAEREQTLGKFADFHSRVNEMDEAYCKLVLRFDAPGHLPTFFLHAQFLLRVDSEPRYVPPAGRL
jgi:hypothetical protein